MILSNGLTSFYMEGHHHLEVKPFILFQYYIVNQMQIKSLHQQLHTD